MLTLVKNKSLASTKPFIIYDAAAGSGKTFTLVKEYLAIILTANQPQYYKYLLAITFTNKAVAEMKIRILKTLQELANWDENQEPSELAKALSEQTNLSYNQLKEKASIISKHLLHHYSLFNVETIDGFNHKLIRTFAKELKLSSSFEVFLDTPLLINEAVDRLLNKTGTDKELTQALLEFALDKLDDDKSWDISRDIAQASKLLIDENNSKAVSELQSKTLKTFNVFKKQISDNKEKLVKEIIDVSTKALAIISLNELEITDFSGAYLPKFFIKLSSGNFNNVSFDAKWQQTLLNGEQLYTKKTERSNPEIGEKIDKIQPDLQQCFITIKNNFYEFQLADSLLRNISPLSVINLVQKEIEAIKAEKNILPIYEFNKLINTQIKNQPAPFIYERLGARYRHFFIDEFQDTSLLQWENLMPLIENALSQQYSDTQTGSLLLVGDVKQAIYRWRGGLPEQFLNLINLQQPFVQKQQVENLDTNYRSRQEIIKFNNNFFTFLSGYFGNPIHQKLYIAGNKQKTTHKKGGYIAFTFVEKTKKEDNFEIQAKEVLNTINKLVAAGYAYEDISILTRKNDQGAFLGNYLMEHDIPVVSPDSLLLSYSKKVQCLVNCVHLSLNPENQEIRIKILYFLYEHFNITEDQHTFFYSLINTSLKNFSKTLERYKIFIDFEFLSQAGVYESCEYLIEQLNFSNKSDAYLFDFMNFVWQFEQQAITGKQLFIEAWQLKKDSLSLGANDSLDAVKLMSIHKSKGLEFKVVIFPFAEQDIYYEQEPKAWYKLEEDKYAFTQFLINYNKQVENFGTSQGKQITQERKQQLELDALNILYVAFTRAIDQLYVIAKKYEPPKKETSKSLTYNLFFKKYLEHINKWEDEKDTYELGVFSAPKKTAKKNKSKEIKPQYISVIPEENKLQIAVGNALLWKKNQDIGIQKGKLFHEKMAKIKYAQDFENSKLEQELDSELQKQIEAVITHPNLSVYYDASVPQTIYTEKEIGTSQGSLLIPDRINILPNKQVIIIDYKTGSPDLSHHDQINSYGQALVEMGYHIHKKYLVYITPSIPEIISVS